MRPSTLEAGAFVSSDNSYCSGVLLDDGVVLTAGHCIDENTTAYRIRFPAVDIYTQYTAAALPHFDGDADIGALKLDTTPDITPVEVAQSDPRVGEAVSMHGTGCSALPTLLHRMLTMTSRTPNESIYLGCACGGDSGSPVLNGGGALVGIHSRSSGPPNKLDQFEATAAANVGSIRAYLAQLGQ